MAVVPRDSGISVTLGHTNYRISLNLDEKEAEAFAQFCEELFNSAVPSKLLKDPGVEQDELLALGWFILARKLQRTDEKLTLLLEQYHFERGNSMERKGKSS